jgi:hypothetical protein
LVEKRSLDLITILVGEYDVKQLSFSKGLDERFYFALLKDSASDRPFVVEGRKGFYRKTLID